MIGIESVRDVLAQRHCLHLRSFPELFGPTNINAQSSNQRLAVALDEAGTVTVLRWPRPSFFDQLKYRSRQRSEPLMGALPNEGAFLGLRVRTDAGGETVWLRECQHRQTYEEGLTDAIRTTYSCAELGLTVTVEDVVAAETDALVRAVQVDRDPDSPVEDAWLLGYANLALVTEKRARNPVEDWCRDGERVNTARYDPDADAVVYAEEGVDDSTDTTTRVAIGVGFGGESTGHQVGGDAHEPEAPEPERRDAFEDASDGPLSGSDSHTGRTTVALASRLSFSAGEATETVYLVAGEEHRDVAESFETLRGTDSAALRAGKREFYESLIGDAPMPDVEDEAIRALAHRALVTLVSNYDPETGAIVASIATQNPYALDWPRDGAFFNHALHLLGLDEWVEQRNRWYAGLQAGSGDPQPGQLDIPEGNWSMNYYGDGVVGGPVPYEIDQTAYTVWTLWDHYAMTGDESYLEAVYPAIRRAGSFFCRHRDADTGLHAPAYEDDNVLRSQTVVGAAPIWLALGAAVKAATVLGRERDARRFRARRAELGAGIERHLWNPAEGAYTGGSRLVRVLDRLESVPVLGDAIRLSPLVPNTTAQPAIVWPVGFHDGSDPRMASHLEHVWKHITTTFAEPEQGDRKAGMYETTGLIALAQAWRDDSERFGAIQRGVEWVAHEHATTDTHVMGEMWMTRNGGVVTASSQPHTWAQVLFYYASLEAFPPEGFEAAEGDSVVAWLRERQRSGEQTVLAPSVSQQQ